MTRRAGLIVGAVFLVTGGTFAGAQAQTVKYKPLKVYKGMKAVVETTVGAVQSSGPQPVLREHDNPVTPQFGEFNKPSNNLPVGSIGDFVRGTVGQKFAGLGATGYEPPDCDMGMGPNYAVVVVNLTMGFYNKLSGGQTFQQNFSQFFSSVGIQGGLSDPKVFYDKVSGRFFVTLIEYNLDPANGISKMLLAVSDDNNPNGTWYKYRLEAKMVSGSNEWWLDYPGFGHNKDAIVITGNMFPLTAGAGYGGCQFIVIPKAPLLTGGAPTITTFRDPNIGTVQPSRSHDAALDKVFGISAQSQNSVKVYGITGLPNSPSLSSASVQVPTWQLPTADAKSAGGRTLDSFDGRIFNASWRSGKLVAAHTIRATNPNSVAMARWYEISTGAWPTSGLPTLGQSGNVQGSDGQDFHMPAININSFGDISMLFTRSSSTIVADMMIAGRKVSDPPGTMGIPIRLETSTGSVYSGFSSRWGDYFAVDVDPVDGYTFWGFGEVGKQNNGWLTFWDKWTITTPGSGGGTEVNPTSVSMYQGSGSSGNLASILASDNLYYSVLSTPVGGLGQIAALEMNFTVPSGTFVSLATKFELSGAAGTSGMLWLHNWGTGKYDHIKSFALKTSDTVTTFQIPNYAKYVNGSRQMKAVVRGLLPQRRGAMPVTFTFKADQIQFLLN